MKRNVHKKFAVIVMTVAMLSTSMIVNAAESYTVKSGDYLKKIAREIYGDKSKWEIIYEANKSDIKNPNLIYPGQVFVIPDNADAAAAPAPEVSTAEASTAEIPADTVASTEKTTGQAAFEKYGLVCNAKLNTASPYTIPCNDRDFTTNGKVTFSDYNVMKSDEAHEALDGYEWQAVTVTVVFDDENSYNHGYSGIVPATFDYYNTAFFDNYKENRVSFSANCNGEEYSGIQYDQVVLQNGWNNNVFTYQFRNFYRVPIGYDGIVVAIYNPSVDWNIGNEYEVAKANTDTILFRLK